MKLSVHIPLDCRPEREYVLKVICEEMLGLSLEIAVKEGLEGTVFLCPESNLLVRDHFFPLLQEAGYRYSSALLPVSVLPVSATAEDCAVLYGNDGLSRDENTLSCELDIFGSAFFMLSRWEETLPTERDDHGRFPDREALAVKLGLHSRPLVDEYCRYLKELLISCGVENSIFASRSFSKNLTCDADYPFYFPHKLSPLRRIAGEVRRGGGAKGAIEQTRKALSYLSGKDGDPYDHFDKMMDLAAERGLKWTFFFMAGGEHALDPPFALTTEKVRGLIRNISEKGHDLGFHPSYLAAENAELFEKEWSVFKREVPAGKAYCRQHYLRHFLPLTFHIQEDCGMEIDSTLGYADHLGFRSGTSLTHSLFDCEKRRTMKLKERPLLLMDVAMKRGNEFSGGRLSKEIDSLISEVKKHEGELTILWHNSSFEMENWESYESVFLQLLNS